MKEKETSSKWAMELVKHEKTTVPYSLVQTSFEIITYIFISIMLLLKMKHRLFTA